MVHPNFQSYGIGKKLMTEVESLFKSCKIFELYTGVKSEKTFDSMKRSDIKYLKSKKPLIK